MASPNGGDSDLPNEVCDITNSVTIYYEKDVRAGMPSFGKKTSESFVLTYLLLIEFFFDILCDIYFQKGSVVIIKLIINVLM